GRPPEPIAEINTADAQRARIQDGDFVEVTSRRGKVIAQCRVTSAIREGTCFFPFHWGRRFGFYKSANNLTLSTRDPLSRQPELKACAVRLRPVPTETRAGTASRGSSTRRTASTSSTTSPPSHAHG